MGMLKHEHHETIAANSALELWKDEQEAGRAEMYREQADSYRKLEWETGKAIGRCEQICKEIDKDSKANGFVAGDLAVKVPF